MKLLEPIKIAPNLLRKNNLKRARYVVEQAESQKVEMLSADDDYWKICRALATLGEDARIHWLKLVTLTPDRDKDKAGKDFTEAVSNTKFKNPSKFFEIAANFGLKTKQPVNPAEEKGKSLARIIIGNDDHAEEFEKYGIWEQDDIYWGMDQRNVKYEISNFIMNILFHVETNDMAAYRLVCIKNIHGHTATMTINTDDMVSLGVFKKIIERKGNFLFKGSDTDLNRLKDKLLREARPTDMVNQLGWHKRGSFYAFANGIYNVKDKQFLPADQYGIVEFKYTAKDGVERPKNYYIPAMAQMFEDKDDIYTNDKKFIYQELSVTFEEWSNQFILVHGKHGTLLFGFYLMSVFSDIVFETLQQFPLMAVCGKRGSGKGSLIRGIMTLFGIPQKQFMLGGANTVKGMMRKFSQYSNAIVWVDEYKNNLPSMTIESLKNISDRVGYTRSKVDNTFETVVSPVKSGGIVSGQDMPTIESGLFSRTILTIKMATNYTEEQRDQYRKLEGIQKTGLSGITGMMLEFRPFFEENFETVFNQEQKRMMKDANKPEIDERLYVNYSALVATAEILSSKIQLPFSMVSFREFCKNALLEHYYMLKGSDDATKFWDVIERLFNRGVIRENREFKLKNGFLYLRTQDVIDLYETALLERRDPNGLDKETLYKYLESDTNTFVKRDKKWFGGCQRWCHIFKYKELGIDLIRAASQEDLNQRYREMKLDIIDDEDQFNDEEDD